jgi:Peptidase family M23
VIRPKAKPAKPKPTVGQPLRGTPPLGAGSYVFPVDGRTDWGDSYGADRSDVPGGWHHGDDLFAPLGTPVVAVTDGVIFSVGWNRVGGWRLWLLDVNGNQYYYAHLSGYTAAGSNDRTVKEGQVLGFVGNTGDAVTTPSHLHFEVHPSSLLYLGYDGAVDPTTYLRTWSLAKNVVVPPPVDLPSKAPPGRGSAVDFRQLLSIHPLKTPVKARPETSTAHYLGRVQAAEHDGSNPERVAAEATASPAGGGDNAIVAGAVLALAALTALVLTARAGRASSE